jgi:hypothetical protein
MDGSTIVVIVILVVFVAGMGTLVFISNRPSKDGSKDTEGKKD